MAFQCMDFAPLPPLPRNRVVAKWPQLRVQLPDPCPWPAGLPQTVTLGQRLDSSQLLSLEYLPCCHACSVTSEQVRLDLLCTYAPNDISLLSSATRASLKSSLAEKRLDACKGKLPEQTTQVLYMIQPEKNRAICPVRGPTRQA